jgi:hypothetical protein
MEAERAKSKRNTHRHGHRRGLETAEGYGTYEQWLQKMYHPYLRNSYRAVRPGGWVAIYVEDWGGRPSSGQRPQYPLREETVKVLAEARVQSGRYCWNFARFVAT